MIQSRLTPKNTNQEKRGWKNEEHSNFIKKKEKEKMKNSKFYDFKFIDMNRMIDH